MGEDELARLIVTLTGDASEYLKMLADATKGSEEAADKLEKSVDNMTKDFAEKLATFGMAARDAKIAIAELAGAGKAGGPDLTWAKLLNDSLNEAEAARNLLAEAAKRQAEADRAAAVEAARVQSVSQSLVDTMRQQVDTYGMSADQIRIYKGEQDGATASALAAAEVYARQKQALEGAAAAQAYQSQEIKKAVQIAQEMETADEKKARRLQELAGLYAGGTGPLDKTSYDRGVKEAITTEGSRTAQELTEKYHQMALALVNTKEALELYNASRKGATTLELAALSHDQRIYTNQLAVNQAKERAAQITKEQMTDADRQKERVDELNKLYDSGKGPLKNPAYTSAMTEATTTEGTKSAQQAIDAHKLLATTYGWTANAIEIYTAASQGATSAKISELIASQKLSDAQKDIVDGTKAAAAATAAAAAAMELYQNQQMSRAAQIAQGTETADEQRARKMLELQGLHAGGKGPLDTTSFNRATAELNRPQGSKDAEQLLKTYTDLSATFGMTARQADIYRAARDGATLRELYALQVSDKVLANQEAHAAAMAKGVSLSASVETSTERKARLLSEYKTALDNTSISQETYNRLVKGLADNTEQATGTLQSFISALQQVYSTISQNIAPFAEFDQKLTQSTAIMSDMTTQQIASLGNLALEMSTKFPIGADKLASAFGTLSKSGLELDDVGKMLGKFSSYSVAGMVDLNEAVRQVTAAQAALGMTSNDSATNLQNMTQVMDALIRGSTITRGSVTELANAMTSELGSSLRFVGKDIHEGIAVLAAFSKQGIDSGRAGHLLGRAIRLLATESNKSKDAHEALGFSVFDASGKMRNFSVIAAQLESITAGMSPAMREATLNQLGFTARTQQSIVPLIGMSKELQKFEAQSRGTGVTMESVTNKQMKSFANQMQLVSNALKAVAIDIGSQVAPALGVLGAILGEVAKGWLLIPDVVRSVVSTVGLAVAAIVGLTLAIRALLALNWAIWFATGMQAVVGFAGALAYLSVSYLLPLAIILGTIAGAVVLFVGAVKLGVADVLAFVAALVALGAAILAFWVPVAGVVAVISGMVSVMAAAAAGFGTIIVLGAMAATTIAAIAATFGLLSATTLLWVGGLSIVAIGLAALAPLVANLVSEYKRLNEEMEKSKKLDTKGLEQYNKRFQKIMDEAEGSETKPQARGFLAEGLRQAEDGVRSYEGELNRAKKTLDIASWFDKSWFGDIDTAFEEDRVRTFTERLAAAKSWVDKIKEALAALGGDNEIAPKLTTELQKLTEKAKKDVEKHIPYSAQSYLISPEEKERQKIVKESGVTQEQIDEIKNLKQAGPFGPVDMDRGQVGEFIRKLLKLDEVIAQIRADKMTDELNKMNDALQTQVNTFGMTENEIARYNDALKGLGGPAGSLNAEALKLANSLRDQSEAQKEALEYAKAWGFGPGEIYRLKLKGIIDSTGQLTGKMTELNAQQREALKLAQQQGATFKGPTANAGELEYKAKQIQAANALIQEFRTPEEKFQDRISQLNDMVEVKALDPSNVREWEAYQRAVAAAVVELEKANNAMASVGVQATKLGSSEAFSHFLAQAQVARPNPLFLGGNAILGPDIAQGVNNVLGGPKRQGPTEEQKEQQRDILIQIRDILAGKPKVEIAPAAVGP